MDSKKRQEIMDAFHSHLTERERTPSHLMKKRRDGKGPMMLVPFFLADIEAEKKKRKEIFENMTSRSVRVSRSSQFMSQLDEVHAADSWRKGRKILFKCFDCELRVFIKSRKGLLDCKNCGGVRTLTNAHYFFNPNSFPPEWVNALEPDVMLSLEKEVRCE